MDGTSVPPPDLAAIKRRQQQTWAAGDFSMVGMTLAIVGELLCEAVDLRPGSRVLDVAAGTGTAALAAARRFCDVVAVDYVPALLERGRERAAAERLAVEFREGDAEALPVPDASFDVVLSTFGVMFAPDQARAAGEVLRVCRCGGTIGLANWVPDGFFGEVFKTTARHVPPPPGLPPAVRWGTEEGLRALLGDGLAELAIVRRPFVLRYPSPASWLDYFRTHYGPTLTAFAALDADGQTVLAEDLLAIVAHHNRSGDGTMMVPADYLEVVARRR